MTIITKVDFSCTSTVIDCCTREAAVIRTVDQNNVSDKTKLYERLHVASDLYRELMQELNEYLVVTHVNYKEKRVVDAVRALSLLRSTIDSYVILYHYHKITPLYPLDAMADIITMSDEALVNYLLNHKKVLPALEYYSFLTWMVDTMSPRLETIVATEISQQIYVIDL